MGRFLGRARLVAANIRAFDAGLRYARGLEPPGPAGAAPQAEANPLRDYFDAHTAGPGLWKWRHYLEIYHRHLAKFVGGPVQVVEVGIYSGGSLLMWADYFGPGCHIYGVDIEPACRAYAGDGVSVFIGDQADPGFWAAFNREVGPVDVLFDDGGHQAHQQIATLRAMLPNLRPGGVYACEDVHGAGHAFNAFVDGLTRPLSEVQGYERSDPSGLQQHVGAVHRYPLLTVIEKPELPVAAFEAPRHGTEWQPFL